MLSGKEKTMKYNVCESMIAEDECKECQTLKIKLSVALRLLKILNNSNRKVPVSPMYSLNPSWRTMQAVGLLIGDVDSMEIIEHLKINDLWDEKGLK